METAQMVQNVMSGCAGEGIHSYAQVYADLTASDDKRLFTVIDITP
jgi:Na+/citrate or Na+/malate symporter